MFFALFFFCVQSTRHVLLGSPEWQTLSAQLHERLQKLLANDHMTSFFSELTPAEQHGTLYSLKNIQF
jgi:hypothetical protein